MWNVYEYRPNDEKVAAMLLVTVAVLVVVFCAGYLLGLRSVHDDGSGNAGAGQQIEQAGTAIHNAADGIQAAAGTADQIGSTIKDAKESAGYIQHTADTSAEIIADCQSIIDAVRRRGKEKAPQN